MNNSDQSCKKIDYQDYRSYAREMIQKGDVYVKQYHNNGEVFFDCKQPESRTYSNRQKESIRFVIKLLEEQL